MAIANHFHVADIKLVETEMPILMMIGDEYGPKKSLQCARIAVLIETLRALGASKRV